MKDRRLLPDSQAKAAGLVAFSLAHALLKILRAKELLTEAEVNAIFEIVLSGLERRFPPDDQVAQDARRLMERIARPTPPTGSARKQR